MNNKMMDFLKKIGVVLVIPCVVYLLFFILRPKAFGDLSLLWTLLTQSMASIILAWGISFEMTAGNMDMSIGAEMILGQLIASVFAKRMGLFGLILGVLLTAIVIFAIKAVMMRLLTVRSMVIFIAFTYIIGSAGYLMMNGASAVIDSDLTILGGFPYNMIIFLVAGIILYVLQNYTVFAAHCRALGGNGTISRTAGINKSRIETISILIASLYAAAAGLISLSRGAGSAPQTGLASLSTVFGAMSGVFISFVLSKYISQVVAIAVGVFSLNIISFGLLAMNAPSQIKDSVNGGFLLLLMCISAIVSRKNEERIKRNASSVLLKKEAKA